MKYIDYCRQFELRETIPGNKNLLIAYDVICEYLKEVKKNDLSIRTGNYIEDLLYEYFAVKGSVDENILKEIMDYYKFNYSMSIHNAIYYLLSTDREHVDDIDPCLWPGIINIDFDGFKYIIRTIIGDIEVYKADKVMADSKYSYIFMKDLMGQCYERSLEILKENNDYRVILSYMPNFFYGGHFHAYLKSDECILDIASNAIYYSIDSANKVLCGEVVAELTYKQVMKKYNTLKNVAPNISSRNKLLTLALYYDQKRN